MPKSSFILYCNCAYSQVVPEDVKGQVLNALTQAGVQFEAVPDLCEMSARQAPALKRWAKADAIKIVACFPRAVKWLFHAGRAPLPQDGVEFLNMRTDTAESIVSSLLKHKTCADKCKDMQLKKTGDWVPWFPVIDYERCANCKQCLNFCLFGVYSLSEQGKVEVQNPSNCKTNCPACARVCPQTAIIFPKYTDSPINGDEVINGNEWDEKRKVDLSELLSGDIHDVIRRRSKSGERFAKDAGRQQEISRLRELQKELDIPPEVLASLSGGQMSKAGSAASSEDCLNAKRSQCDRECKGGEGGRE